MFEKIFCYFMHIFCVSKNICEWLQKSEAQVKSKQWTGVQSDVSTIKKQKTKQN